MKKRLFLTLVIILAALLAAAWWQQDRILRYFFKPTPSVIQQGIVGKDSQDIEIVATELAVPWEVVVLEGGDLLVTERPGTIKRIGKESYKVEGVEHIGEGGLLGLAVHPDFANNGYVYVYLTTAQDGDKLTNRIERYKLEGNSLQEKTAILAQIPAARNHDGGRIAFGPDGKLYATTGDAADPELAQDTTSLAGKILRLNDDGSIPADNPFGNAVYSYGHRNPQGLAWDDQGRLWSTEHGPSGPETGHDELNLIAKGGNYGWPLIRGAQTAAGMVTPVVQSGSDETWAPAGLAYHKGSLYFTGLRGESLYQAVLQADASVTLKAHFRSQYGRLRAVVSHGNHLYITTSNTDGRGDKKEGDDKIIRVSHSLFD